MGSSSTRKRGSKAFWPRVRAKKWTPVVNSWASKNVKSGSILGFPAYKVGMTSIGVIDNFSHTLTKGTEINVPVTVLECPAVKVLSVKLYALDEYANLQVVKEITAPVKDKNLSRKIDVAKKTEKAPTVAELMAFAKSAVVEDVKIKVATTPAATGIGKKRPEILDLGISGTIEEKLNLAMSKLGHDIKVSDVFVGGEVTDSHGITKGQGWQGAVTRFGVKLTSHKSEKKRRHAGNVGAFTPRRVLTTIPLPGQHGFHERTEWNKWVMKVSSNPTEINPSSGFNHYGVIKNDFILVKGSIQGPKNRLVTLVKSIRPNNRYPKVAPQVTYINKK